MEIWLNHKSDPKIWISDSGAVRQRINVSHPERKQWLVRKPDIDRDGYHVYRIEGKRQRVHRLVYETFVGDLEDNKVICHLDGNPSNNAASNLTQATQSVNISHKKSHGTLLKGSKHPRTKATEEQVSLIRTHLKRAKRSVTRRLARGETYRIAEEVGVSVHLVRDLSSKGDRMWQ